jgi:hypothetical protein
VDRRLAIVGAVALAAALSIPAQANTNEPVHWAYQSSDFDVLIEQQTPCSPDGTHCGAGQPDPSLWVTNVAQTLIPAPPTYCVWDPDDDISGAFLGAYINPGVTVTGTLCEYADDSPHLVYLSIPYAGLTGTLTVGNYLTLAVASGHTGCILGPQHHWPSSLSPSVYSDPRITPVSGSNGGAAEKITINLSLTNTTSHRIRDVLVWGVVTDVIGWNTAPCPNPLFTYGTPLYPVGSYPQVWWSNQ